MKKIVLLSCAVFGASAFGSSNIHKITLRQDSIIEGKTLKAGDYKISFENGNAVIKQGKQVFQTPARLETQTAKAEDDELFYKDNNNLEGIEFAGTQTEIVFSPAATAHSGM